MAISVAVLGAPAFGQAPPSAHNPSPPTATQPNTQDPQGCAQSQVQAVPSQKQGAGKSTEGNSLSTSGQAPLSDKLAKSEGVICPPPGVDPEIRSPAPNVGKMPVIPPPGTPGGNPNVRPK